MEVKEITPVKLFCGLILSDVSFFPSVHEMLKNMFGNTQLIFGPVPFDWTDYYREEMGDNLQKMFVSFCGLIDPAEIGNVKIKTNMMEKEFFSKDGKRRVNIDPGYITPAKLVLATTKDFSHRIYLGNGIFAEITLNFSKKGFIYHRWTYPDFKSGKYNDFFLKVRENLLMELKDRDK